MVAAQQRCSALDEASSRAEVERRKLEGELLFARQQLQAKCDAGRKFSEVTKQMEALAKEGTKVAAAFDGATSMTGGTSSTGRP